MTCLKLRLQLRRWRHLVLLQWRHKRLLLHLLLSFCVMAKNLPLLKKDFLLLLFFPLTCLVTWGFIISTLDIKMNAYYSEVGASRHYTI